MVLFKKEREASDLPIQSFESLYPKSKSEHSKQFKKDSSFAPYINIHTIHMKKKNGHGEESLGTRKTAMYDPGFLQVYGEMAWLL